MWKDGESVMFRADGGWLEGKCHGPSPDTAPTIMMLHEGLGCVDLWRDFPRKLAEATRYGVFTYSRRGYGASDPAELPRPVDYMTREAVEVLPEVLGAIGFTEGILLGHSDGASIAAIYAGSIQDHRVRGLVLMAPHFFTEPMGLAAIAKAREAYETGDLRAVVDQLVRETAEGVETAEEAAMIRDMGCDKIQGYHFGRPMPVEEVRAVFKRSETIRTA